MKSEVIARLSQFIKDKGISISFLEREIEVSHGVISKALKNETSISHYYLEKIALLFPDLDLDWLLRGKGTVSVPQDSITPQNLQALVRKEVQEALKLQQA